MDQENINQEANQLITSKETLTNIVDTEKIINAGQQLKGIVYVMIFAIIVFLILYAVALNSKKLEELQFIYSILIVAALLSNLIIIMLLFSAGDNLEKSVAIKKNKPDEELIVNKSILTEQIQPEKIISEKKWNGLSKEEYDKKFLDGKISYADFKEAIKHL